MSAFTKILLVSAVSLNVYIVLTQSGWVAITYAVLSVLVAGVFIAGFVVGSGPK